MRAISLLGMTTFAIVLAHCASESGIVGGQCAVGYEPCGHACCVSANKNGSDGGIVANGDGSTMDEDGGGPLNGDRDGSMGHEDGSSSSDDGSTSDDGSSSNDAGSGDSGTCTNPEILCGNVCVDPTSDPDNCGQCGKVCPSNSCVNGMCVGSAPGHLVAIGHDYQTAPQQGSAQARVVVNSMLLPLSNPVRVMSFEHYSDNTAVTNVKTIVQNAAKQLGRQLAFTVVTQDMQVTQQLDITSYDVLFVPDQKNASQGTMSSLGTAWKNAGAIDAFMKAGGIVVGLDGGNGEMPDLFTQLGVLSVSSHMGLKSPNLIVSAPNDAIGSGVVSPYVPTNGTVSMSAESNGGNVTYVVKNGADPVVIHKVFP